MYIFIYVYIFYIKSTVYLFIPINTDPRFFGLEKSKMQLHDTVCSLLAQLSDFLTGKTLIINIFFAELLTAFRDKCKGVNTLKKNHFCMAPKRCWIKLWYLGHVDESQGQRLVAQDGPVLVSLPSLQHDLKLVGVPLQEVRVLQVNKNTRT